MAARLPSDGEILDVVEEIYDCVIQPARWPACLERLVGLLNCRATGITIHDPIRKYATFSAHQIGITPDAIDAYNRTYLPLNPLLTSGWYCELDEPIVASRYIGEQEWRACKYYREFPSAIDMHEVIGVHIAKSQSRYGLWGLGRSQDRGVFSDDEIAAVRRLAPHLRRAVTIADLLGVRTLQQDMLSATLDLLTVGIVLVDQQGRIVHANAAGQRALEDTAALRRDGDLLAARDPKSSADLRDAIATATSGQTIDLPKSGIAVPIPSTGGPDLAAWVLPLDGGLRNELAAPFAARAAIFIRELGGDSQPFPGELFVKRYGITPAECRVLMMLTQGMTPAEAADAVGSSLPTVKTHMARLFAKTGTTGQTELMRLAMSALAPAVSA